jgi:hypothetical protein
MVSLKFHDVNNPEDFTLQVRQHPSKTFKNQLAIEIDLPKDWGDSEYACICLDKATAIKFSKELRKQIALLD